ncbi:hypothetical protein F4780DRAFT_783926 [Xylariomycetidae sp. FL0641]|nr:hypothetical protein F4780DRAFT_783926 [Xylariomycetidae sp. FL0641]
MLALLALIFTLFATLGFGAPIADGATFTTASSDEEPTAVPDESQQFADYGGSDPAAGTSLSGAGIAGIIVGVIGLFIIACVLIWCGRAGRWPYGPQQRRR